MILLLFLAANDFERIAALAKEGQAAALTQALSDEIGARMSGSDEAARAVAWGVETMQRLGYKNVRREPVRVPKWSRGEEWGEIVTPRRQRLHLAALGGSIGVAELKGELVEVPSLQAIEALGARAAGKIVFVNQAWAGYEKTVPVRWGSAIQAARVGAIGVIIRSTGSGAHGLPHTGGMSYEAEVKKVPAAAVSPEDAGLLHRLLQKGPVVVRMSLGARDEGMVDSYNVVGEIPGRDKPDEIVLLGCHLDSWDLGAGAIDDGAGCGIMLDAGRILAQKPARRTVRVVLYMSEEHGIVGAKAYAQAHASELAKHVAALEADSGTGRPEGFAASTDSSLLAKWVAPFGYPVRTVDHGGADLIPLGEAGVPLLNVDQDMSTYFDWHHTAGDTFDKVDPAALIAVTHATAYLTWMVAEAKETLPRGRPAH